MSKLTERQIDNVTALTYAVSGLLKSFQGIELAPDNSSGAPALDAALKLLEALSNKALEVLSPSDDGSA